MFGRLRTTRLRMLPVMPRDTMGMATKLWAIFLMLLACSWPLLLSFTKASKNSWAETGDVDSCRRMRVWAALLNHMGVFQRRGLEKLRTLDPIFVHWFSQLTEIYVILRRYALGESVYTHWRKESPTLISREILPPLWLILIPIIALFDLVIFWSQNNIPFVFQVKIFDYKLRRDSIRGKNLKCKDVKQKTKKWKIFRL